MPAQDEDISLLARTALDELTRRQLADYPTNRTGATGGNVSPGTPPYYAVIDGHDLYALFEKHYGEDMLLAHLEMEAMQYLWRCRTKDNYSTDIRKARVILERIEQIRARIT